MKLNELCLEITNNCPMNCMHCSTDAGAKLGNELEINEIKKVIKEFSNLGGDILEISGGEPTSHKRIFEIIDYSKEFNLEVRLYTSGFLINKLKISKLKNLRLDKIIFNLQGATSAVHEKITRTKGSFSRVIKNIKECVSNDIWVGVHFVPMKPNFDELLNAHDLCSSLNIDEFALLRFVPQGRGWKNRSELELSPLDLFNFFSKIYGNSGFDTSNIRIGRPFNPSLCQFKNNNMKGCNAGKDKCLIKPNGDVAPCPAFKQNQKFVIGNVRELELSEIWNDSPKWNIFREFDCDELNGKCRNCYEKFSCRGGCPAQRVIATNDIDAVPDPICLKNKYPEFNVENLLINEPIPDFL